MADRIGNPGRDSEMFRCRTAKGTYDGFKAIALELGYTWGEAPQPSKVLELIIKHQGAIAAILKELKKDT